MKLQILSRYDRLGASTRIRTLQYIPWLEDAGFTVAVSALFDRAYVAALHSGGVPVASIPLSYWRRVRDLRGAVSADVIWVEYECLPWLPWWLERALLPGAVPCVTDYDDAIFHRYDHHPSALVRRALGRKIDRFMARSDLVIAGNAYLETRARSAGARRTELVPSVVDGSVYRVRHDSVPDAPIGWIGSPSTWQFVQPLVPVLRSICNGLGRRFLAVGAPGSWTSDAEFEFVDWSEDREIDLLHRMSIGIMPLPDTPWSQGKCGYKLIQYMGCGLPVVASPVGVNTEIVDHGVNGFLAETEADWRRALDALLADPELRRRMGAAGRRKVEERYSIQVQGPRVARLLRDVVETDRTAA